MSHFYRNIFSVFILFVFSGTAWSLDWTINPSLNIEEIYSDNIRLEKNNKKAAFVSEVSPSISIKGQSTISTFDLNYRAQGLYNANGDSGLDINNQLQMNTQYEFVKDRLFLDSSSSMSQQNTSNRRIVSDNVSGGNDSTTVSTFQLSPYWKPHFKGFADGELRVTYDRVSTDGSNNTLSNTNSLSQNIRLNSGRNFSHISWSLLFNNSNRSNADSENVNFQDSTAEIRYALGREFSIFARAGHSSNSFASNTESSQNGISYTFGGQWQPSQQFRLEAGYGNNRFVTVDLSPFNRLHWITTYTKNDIGLNTGDVWNTVLNYNTRRTVWSLSYNEQTTTTQQLLLDQPIFTVNDNVDIRDQDALRNTRLPSLTDEVFITKRADISVTFTTGKSDVSASLFRTLRTFEQSQNDEKVTGITGSWNWKFTRRSSLSLRSNWQKTQSDGDNAFSDKRFDFSIGVTRNIFARLNGNVEYRFTDQKSNDNLNSYTENRITANLTYQF